MIITLAGNNSFTRGKKLADLRNSFAREYGAENIEVVNAEDLELNQLPTLLQGASLFSAHRMVIVKDLSASKEVAEKFSELIGNINEDITVVVIESQPDKRTSLYKTLKSKTEFYEFNEPKEYDLLKWIEECAKEKKGMISSRDAQMLLDYVGIDQQRLAGEIEKLVNFQPNITPDTIEKLVERRAQSTVFQLLDYVITGDKKKSMTTLENLEKAFEDPFQITNLLIWQIQALAVVNSAGNRSDSEIAKETKLNPYVVTKTKGLARRVDAQSLNKIINKVAELDLALKTSAGKPWRLLEYTILSL